MSNTDRADPLRLIGTTIAEKYAIESVVGEGGFAIVYRATHALWKRPVAVKVFKALSDVPAKDRERLLDDFVREGALLAELSERSAAIVQARDVGTVTVRGQEQIPYMVLEWLEGATLESVLEKERKEKAPLRGVDEMMKLIEPAAFALALAHSKGIAHRDVKPANIFVLGNARAADVSVKLLDFGIAKVVQDVQKVGGAFSKTAGNVTSFTPLYGAPEQFNRSYGATGPWTDVFSLAVLCVEILSGHEGLEGDDVVQLAFSSANPQRRPTPRNYGAHVNDAVEQVFTKATAVKPDDRYATAGDFWNALREAQGMGEMPGRLSISVDASSALHPAHAGVASTQLAPASDPSNRVSQTGPRASAPVRVSSSGDVAITDNARTAAAPFAPPTPEEQKKASITLWIVIGITILVIVGGGYGIYRFFEGGEGGGTAPTPPASASAGASASASASASAVALLPPGACAAGMVKVPGGDFYMGSAENAALANEKPPHPVHLDAYCLDETEVTVAAYRACSDTGQCLVASKTNDWRGITEAESKMFDPLCNANFQPSDGGPNAHGQHPINCVSWDQARTYCEWKGGRLPTEAEWEFAARGSDGRIYPWGDDPPNATHLNACGKECAQWEGANKVTVATMYDEDDGWPATAPVKSFPKGVSKFGNYDMVGNVWEWVADFYAPYSKGSANAPRVTNPKGPDAGTERVIRGGAFNAASAGWVRPAFRYSDTPEKKSYGIGFRCAKNP
jgi:formylglycine-generating enzyme required for sulfatase activity/serine/threonine protein kinase